MPSQVPQPSERLAWSAMAQVRHSRWTKFMRVSSGSNRPFLLAVSSHWVSLTGLALSLTALISWMFVLPLQIRGHAGNPYIGILVFIFIPIIFFAGLGLIPLGVFLGRRRIRKGMEQAITDPRLALR